MPRARHRITPIDTDGIIYTLSPPGSPAGTYPPSPGQSVTVTATLAPAGVGWPDVLPDGWTETSTSTATFTVVLPAIACTPVQPVAPNVTQATCSGGVVTTPTVALSAAPAAVTYAAGPQGPYVGTVDTTVTVTASLAAGFSWGQMPDGWTQVDLVTATFTVNLVGTTCADVTPVAPSVTPAVCTGGSTTTHSITPAVTDGITYSFAPPGNPPGAYPASPAQTVTVLATLTDTGVAWPAALPDGWTETSDTTATFTVDLPNITCVPTQPVGPFVTQASCVNGVVTAPTIDLATTSPGISYVVNPPGPYDGTKTYTDIVVTATLAPGFSWGQMPPGWVQVDGGTATFNVTLIGTSCAMWRRRWRRR